MVFPLILPIGLIYFSLRYFIQKYNLLCLFAIPKEGLSRISENSQYFLQSALFFFQIVTSFTFMLNRHEVYYILGGILALISLILMLGVFICMYRNSFRRNYVEGKSMERAELLTGDFRHPLMTVGVEQLGLSSF